MKTESQVRTEPSITLHSSWFGIGAAGLGVTLLILFATAVVASNGLNIVTGVIAFAALAAALVVLLDMPIATRFEADAIERITPLRRRRLGFSQIDRFSRMRRAMRRPGAGVTSTGLIAMRGRRQVLLVDRIEGHLEHEELRAVIGMEQADRLLSDVSLPPLNRTPTWVGRRKRWHPEDADARRSADRGGV